MQIFQVSLIEIFQINELNSIGLTQKFTKKLKKNPPKFENNIMQIN